jgi:hypothetical protein
MEVPFKKYMPMLPDFNLSHLEPARLRRNCFSAFKWVFAVSSILVFVSCGDFRPAEPLETHYVKVTDVNRDTIIVIPNGKSASMASISFAETLSDTALVRIASDTAFSTHGVGYLLPVTNAILPSISGLTGDSLYIKYQPYKKPVTGDLTIEIIYQK